MEQPSIDYFEKLSRGDDTIKQKFIDVIKFELPMEIEAYYINLRSNEFGKTVECVHKLKHKIAVLGLEEYFYNAEKYEESLKEGNKEFQEEFEKTLDIITRFVSNL
jgi:HPt (histidine-containing phosphotransfer) domain-containing protein